MPKSDTDRIIEALHEIRDSLTQEDEDPTVELQIVTSTGEPTYMMITLPPGRWKILAEPIS
jgi:hypothetical protein